MKLWNDIEPVLSGEEEILRSIGCQKTDPSYAEYKKAFYEVLALSRKALKVSAAACMGRIPEDFPKSMRFYGRDMIFFCITVGDEITKVTDAFMAKGEFVKGMIVDGIAGNCLFSCEKIILHEIERYARENGFGIEGIYDAPDSIEGRMQNLIAAKLKAGENLGVSVTENYMMSPVKTYACVMPLLDDPSVMNIYHDCAKCGSRNCSYRKE